MDNPVIAATLKSVSSSEVEVVATRGNDTVFFHEKNMIGGKCEYLTFNLTLSHNTIHFTLGEDMKDTFNATLLRTSTGHGHVWKLLHQWFPGKIIHLIRKNWETEQF
ncbi:hypothetical protein GJAV_G00267580 [Gymnothorax javanicus]|nr:hypothetical protein GJAV_G00267580 [Gymnothorax javanicus]